MKGLVVSAAVLLVGITFYFSYIHVRTDWYARNVSPQEAVAAGVRDVEDELNKRYREQSLKAADQVKKGDLGGAEATLSAAKRERETALTGLASISGKVPAEPTGVIRNCPGNYMSNGELTSMDLESCSLDSRIWLELQDKFHERIYEVSLSVKTANGELTPVVAEPIIRVLKTAGDGFSIAEMIGKSGNSYLYKLRGEVVFINKGNAGHAEIRLKP